MRLASLTFISRVGFSASTLACLVDSLVRVSRRVGKSLFGRIARSSSGHAPTGPPGLTRKPRSKLPLWMRHPILPLDCPQAVRFPSLSSGPFYSALSLGSYAAVTGGSLSFTSTASFSTVSGLLTLFSKFFSSFLHSTCSLSVSYMYLALGEVYLPLRAAIPSNPTLRNLTR